jgi:site-specific DNA recombinase
MRRLGFKTKRGGKMAKNKLSTILNNPFYIGLIRIKRTGEMFRGAHEPLVSKALFDRVHLVLSGKHRLKLVKHDFIFRRLLTCAECRYALIGERQKGHIYYRCHSRECPMTGIREEEVEKGITVVLSPLSLNPEGLEEIRGKIHALRDNWDGERNREIRAVTLELGNLRERLNRLTDAYLDRMIDKQAFEERRTRESNRGSNAQN